MSDRQLTIAIDAMGGEQSPYKTLKGAEIFLQNNQQVNLIFFGNKDSIKDIIRSHKLKISNYDIVNCTENVSDEDKANTILRSRKESSIYKGLTYVRDNPGSGFVSAGNTAALMILSRSVSYTHLTLPTICSV